MRKLAGTITPCQSKAAATRFMPFPARGEERRNHQHRHEGAHGEGIAPRQPRHRRPGLERLGRAQRPLDMGAPQRDGIRIFGRRGDLVGDRGGRPMGQSGVAVEPPQAVHPARDAQHQKRGERRGGEQKEDAEADRPPDRRQP